MAETNVRKGVELHFSHSITGILALWDPPLLLLMGLTGARFTYECVFIFTHVVDICGYLSRVRFESHQGSSKN